jgi:DNA-binding HxlR family transcriptional regulator
MLSETDFDLLLGIKNVPKTTAKMLLESPECSLSKQHLYLRLGKLHDQGMVVSKAIPTGRSGAPEKALKLTKKGKKVVRIASQLKEALEN